MSFQLKRINPFWHTHPMIPTAVAIGGICGAMGYAKGVLALALLGGLVAGAGILAAARPALSALLATLGLLGGLVTFVIAPDLNASTYTAPWKITSILFYTLFYTVLMDAIVLVVSVIYNFFAGAVGLGGLRLELESIEEETAA
jgi:hypothetical protein